MCVSVCVCLGSVIKGFNLVCFLSSPGSGRDSAHGLVEVVSNGVCVYVCVCVYVGGWVCFPDDWSRILSR